MSNDIAYIQYYYEQGQIALKKNNHDLAASMFKQCYEIYEDAELPVFNAEIKRMGQDAREKYREWGPLDENDFDNIEYGS